MIHRRNVCEKLQSQRSGDSWRSWSLWEERIRLTIFRKKKSSRGRKGPLPSWNGQIWTGVSATLSHLHCKRQIASIASLWRKFLSLIVQVPMGLMDFITAFVGKEVSGELLSWVPFSSFHKISPLSLSYRHLLKPLYFHLWGLWNWQTTAWSKRSWFVSKQSWIWVLLLSGEPHLTAHTCKIGVLS